MSNDKMVKARTQLLFKHPFFAALVFKLKLIPVEAGVLKFNTMATDGRKIWYYTGFVEEITVPEIMGVLAHEALHCALKHISRIGTRNTDKWGSATDYVVNILVLDAKMQLTEGCLIDYQYAGMTAEKVYDLLPDEPEDEGEGQPRPGEILQPTDDNGDLLSSGEIKQLEGEWKMAVEQATAIAKQAGKMPGGMEEIIEELNKEPQVAWQEEFRQFMTTPAEDDYDWCNPDRRFIYNNLYLPGEYSLAMGCVVWVTDSSYSISQKEFAAFGAEFNGVVEETSPESIWMMFCDTKVSGEREMSIEDFPITELKPTGRGGTLFDPVFEWVVNNGIRPDCLVYLTDLEPNSPLTIDAPDYPVLWINTNQRKGQDDVPWGKVITIEV
jgi:predicted metal-dependent peptidase